MANLANHLILIDREKRGGTPRQLLDDKFNLLNCFSLSRPGSQFVGMGKELANNHPVAHQTFEEADDALGYKLSQLCFEGPEERLKLTEITQPAILTTSVAAWRVLQEKGLKPDFVAGHSLVNIRRMSPPAL